MDEIEPLLSWTESDLRRVIREEIAQAEGGLVININGASVKDVASIVEQVKWATQLRGTAE